MLCLIADIRLGGLEAVDILWVSQVLSPIDLALTASLSELLHFKFTARHMRSEYVLLA